MDIPVTLIGHRNIDIELREFKPVVSAVDPFWCSPTGPREQDLPNTKIQKPCVSSTFRYTHLHWKKSGSAPQSALWLRAYPHQSRHNGLPRSFCQLQRYGSPPSGCIVPRNDAEGRTAVEVVGLGPMEKLTEPTILTAVGPSASCWHHHPRAI